MIGATDPPGYFTPWDDPLIPNNKRLQEFCTHVSTYFDHPYFRPDGTTLERVVTNLIMREPKGEDRTRPSTFETFTDEEKRANLDAESLMRSEIAFFVMPKETFKQQLESAVFLDQSNSDKNILPGARAHFLYCEKTVWASLWCCWELERFMKEWADEGRTTRIDSVSVIPGANHLVSLLITTSNPDTH